MKRFDEDPYKVQKKNIMPAKKTKVRVLSLSEMEIKNQEEQQQINNVAAGKLVEFENILKERKDEISSILFRVHLWREMAVEMKEKRAIFGINFGQPQKSITMEKVRHRQYLHDGWIAPHNSFLNIIYRGGIIGFAVVITLFGTLCFLTRRFIIAKSATGLLLTSVLIGWSVFSMFGVILELPYNAILFWSLFGMTFAYYHSLPRDHAINPKQQATLAK